MERRVLTAEKLIVESFYGVQFQPLDRRIRALLRNSWAVSEHWEIHKRLTEETG
jgi:hypothetical protein